MMRLKELAHRLIASSPLQLEFGLTGPALPTGMLPVAAVRGMQGLVPEAAEFEVWSHLEEEGWCTKSQAFSGEEETPPKELQEYLWQQFFSDPTQWWDNRRSKSIPWHPDFRHKKSKVALWLHNGHKPAWVDSQLARWDAGMRPPESVSTSVGGQEAFGRLAAHESLLEVGMCRKLCENGRITDAVDALNLLLQRGCYVPNNVFYQVLKRCIAHKDLVLGRRIHALTIKSGYEGDAFLATHLIGLYASHGKLEEAMRVFTKVSAPDSYNWATIIFAYARHGKAAEAVRLYRQMRDSTVKPGNRIYVAALKACATAGDLVAGKEVHAHILESPGKQDIFVQTGLVDMYVKCGSLEDARRVFDRLPDRDVVTWNAMLAGYAQQGMGQEALSLYKSMQQDGVVLPGPVTFVCLLQACASVGVGALHQGRQLHAQIAERGLQGDMVVCTCLIDMYAKCGSLEDARNVFDRLPVRDVVTWNAMLAGYAQQGMGEEALGLYSSMQQEGTTTPDSVTYACLLPACASVQAGALHHGKQLHAQIVERGLQDNGIVGACLIDMYSNCGSVEDARTVFDRLPVRDVVVWTAMISGYTQQGMGQEALSLYSGMQVECITPPDCVTFACLLQACANVGALPQGKQLHAQIEERGMRDDGVLGGSLVNMYAKCGSLGDARSVFDRLPDRDVVTWNAMIAGYAHQGMGQEALSLYSSMQQEGITPPDSVTFVCLLQACAIVAGLPLGKQLHAQIQERGLQADPAVCTGLIDMYAKCGSLEHARNVFERLPDRNVVTYNAMLAGYAQQGMGQEALSLYRIMQKEGTTPPDSVTFVCLLQACAIVAALPLGKELHAHIEERGLQADPVVGAALVNMYAKCGSMFDSQQVFDSLLPERTREAWGALICGYTRQGDSEVVFHLLDRMKLEGIQPDGITILSLLTACSHVGLVDIGRKYFKAMSTDYGISPTVDHYTCMMDLLGRAGHLDEALQMAKTMPFPPNAAVWRTLLSSCQKWNNVEIGQQAFEFAVSVDENDATSYVLMSNIYASAQMWEEAEEMQARRKKSGAWKQPGQSWWIDMGGVVHTFVVGGQGAY